MRPEAVARFAYGSASVELAADDERLLEGIRFLYRSFDTPPGAPAWRYRIEDAGHGRTRLFLGDDLVESAEDEVAAVQTLDDYVSWHLLGELSPRPVVLHAAGLEAPGGGTLVIVAPSGGGKSTLAAALIARGAAFLSDEHVPLDPRDLRPLSYPRALGLKHDAPPALEGPSGETLLRSAERHLTWWHPPRARAAGRHGDPVVAIVHAEHDPATPTRLAPLARPQSLARLLAETPTRSDDHATAFATLGALVDRRPSFLLRHSDAAAAAELLLDLARPARREAS